MSHSDYSKADFDLNPLMFYYEITMACDLVCKHCRASAQEEADPNALSGEQSRALIDQVCEFPRPPMMVFTGGDPLKRADLFDLIRHAVGNGLQVALTPSATPLATIEAFEKARDAGVRRFGQAVDCLAERQTLRFHDEIDGAAVGAAAEAVVKTLFVIDREGRRFFLVEGA